ncbi:hypothetical protein MJ561_11700 [Klebsiella pneumoniae]|nr:hypothetical protein MJ561_11700 [Klebsiella pneumoniae]
MRRGEAGTEAGFHYRMVSNRRWSRRYSAAGPCLFNDLSRRIRACGAPRCRCQAVTDTLRALEEEDALYDWLTYGRVKATRRSIADVLIIGGGEAQGSAPYLFCTDMTLKHPIAGSSDAGPWSLNQDFQGCWRHQPWHPV